jgi:ribulose bisphosphate carboxylase small subunit
MTKTKTSYKPKITENDIKKQVKDWLSYKGYFHFHVLQGLGAYKGIPDIIAIKDNRVLFLEIKKPTGKQSQYQKDFENNIKSQGGEYILVRCLEDLIKANV